MESNRWRWLALMAMVLAALVIGACGDDDDDDGDDAEPTVEVEEYDPNTTPGQIQERGEIRIGVKYDVPPFGFLNPQTNEVEGFDVDLGNAVAAKLGVEPNFIEAISDNRIPFLQDGTVDVILSTMTITEERDLEIDFSEPYYIAGGRVLVPEDSDITGIDDLDGRRVCTARGSTYQDSIRREAPNADLRLIDTYSECFELIQTGAVDAVSTDDVILTGMIIQDETLQLVGDTFTTEPYGAGVPEGDAELQEVVNEVIAEYTEDGRWEASYEEWIGQYIPDEQEQGPPTMTLEEAIRLNPLP